VEQAWKTIERMEGEIDKSGRRSEQSQGIECTAVVDKAEGCDDVPRLERQIEAVMGRENLPESLGQDKIYR
jgi:hypothetical protein